MISLPSAFTLGGSTDELPSSRQDVDTCLLGVRIRDGIIHNQDGLISKFSDFCNDRHVAVNDLCRTKGFEFVSMFKGKGGGDGIQTRVSIWQAE